MTRIEVIDVLKTELSKVYTITTTKYEDGKVVDTIDTSFPNNYMSLKRDVVESALRLLEEPYDL